MKLIFSPQKAKEFKSRFFPRHISISHKSYEVFNETFITFFDVLQSGKNIYAQLFLNIKYWKCVWETRDKLVEIKLKCVKILKDVIWKQYFKLFILSNIYQQTIINQKKMGLFCHWKLRLVFQWLSLNIFLNL